MLIKFPSVDVVEEKFLIRRYDFFGYRLMKTIIVGFAEVFVIPDGFGCCG